MAVRRLSGENVRPFLALPELVGVLRAAAKALVEGGHPPDQVKRLFRAARSELMHGHFVPFQVLYQVPWKSSVSHEVDLGIPPHKP